MWTKRKISGGILAVIGFMLSPLSWWNDLFVNVPLALGFGWLAGLIYEPAFNAAVIVGYWLTNVLGFVLMHKGAKKWLAQGDPEAAGTRRELRQDLLISVLYTGVILLLLRLGVLQPFHNYFKGP
jgi:hypothetical protein